MSFVQIVDFSGSSVNVIVTQLTLTSPLLFLFSCFCFVTKSGAALPTRAAAIAGDAAALIPKGGPNRERPSVF